MINLQHHDGGSAASASASASSSNSSGLNDYMRKIRALVEKTKSFCHPKAVEGHSHTEIPILFLVTRCDLIPGFQPRDLLLMETSPNKYVKDIIQTLKTECSSVLLVGCIEKMNDFKLECTNDNEIPHPALTALRHLVIQLASSSRDYLVRIQTSLY